nr:ankyrin repeat-containing protein itn1 [Quercus suber]
MFLIPAPSLPQGRENPCDTVGHGCLTSQIEQGTRGERDLEKGLMMMTMTPIPSSTQNPLAETSPLPSPSPCPSATATASGLILSNFGKRIDQAGKKKYVKQVTGRHNDTKLHLAA